MLSLKDFEGRKIKKHCSPFDMLVEVACVAAEKLEIESSTGDRNLTQPRFIQNNSLKRPSATFLCKETSCDPLKKKKKKKKEIILTKKPASKKTKMVDFGPNPPPNMPVEFEERIRELDGEDVVLVIQKPLYKSDISRGECRFSIPAKQVKNKFLTEEEETLLDVHKEKHLSGIESELLDPSLSARPICLRKWDMGKKDQRKKTNSLFVLVKGWFSVVDQNKLKVGDIVQLYSFRVGSRLRFAMVIVKRSEDEEAKSDSTTLAQAREEGEKQGRNP